MTLRDVLRSARRHWAWVVLPVVVLTAGMAFVSSRSVPVYRSTATLYVALAAGSDAGDLNQGSSYTQSQMTSFARLATLPVTLDPVVRDLDLDRSSRALAGSVAVTSPKDSSLLDIAVTGPSADLTADVANAVASRLGEVVEELAPQGEAGSAIQATVVSEAVAPTSPIAPSTRRNVLAGFLAGILLGLVAAWARDALDTRVRRAQDLRAAVDAPVLGVIRQRRRPADGAPVRALEGAQSEDFRRVRANLEMVGRPGAAKVLVFTSAMQAEGKSFVASRVAAALAAAGARTLLVDADLRCPTIATQMGVEGGVGLTDCLVGRVALGDAVQDVGPRLAVLASGPVPPNPAEMLSYPEFAALVDEAATQFDVVVVDAPPVVPVADAAVIARHATGVVVVADARRVRRPQLREAVEAVQLGGGRVVGTVLNREKGVGDDALAYVARKPSARRRRAGRSSHRTPEGAPVTRPAHGVDHVDAPERDASSGVPVDERPRVGSDAPADVTSGDAEPAASPDTGPDREDVPARRPAAGGDEEDAVDRPGAGTSAAHVALPA